MGIHKAAKSFQDKLQLFGSFNLFAEKARQACHFDLQPHEYPLCTHILKFMLIARNSAPTTHLYCSPSLCTLICRHCTFVLLFISFIFHKVFVLSTTISFEFVVLSHFV